MKVSDKLLQKAEEVAGQQIIVNSLEMANTYGLSIEEKIKLDAEYLIENSKLNQLKFEYNKLFIEEVENDRKESK